MLPTFIKPQSALFFSVHFIVSQYITISATIFAIGKNTYKKKNELKFARFLSLFIYKCCYFKAENKILKCFRIEFIIIIIKIRIIFIIIIRNCIRIFNQNIIYFRFHFCIIFHILFIFFFCNFN